MPDNAPIRRALLSVSDKTDLVPFARALAARGVDIISTGGTAARLIEAGVAVTPVETVTGFPEGLDGRVKTLHPKVHGALLAVRDNRTHQAFMREHGIEPIDLVCINLYPFEETVGNPDVRLSDAIENVDIGGPAMLRAAAKNFGFVTVVTSPRRYDRVITEMDANENATTFETRAELAASAFARVAEYDAAIATFLSRRTAPAFGQVLRLGYTKADELRYGENPHQRAALYRDPVSTGPTIVNARQLHGKPLSYNNLNDGAAALEITKELHRLDASVCGAAVIKHATPCAAAHAGSTADAIADAMAGDPVAAYGGILSVNQPVDLGAAEAICAKGHFLEVILAPAYDDDALGLIRDRWKNARALAVGESQASPARKLEHRSVPGGMLVQERDARLPITDEWTHAAGPVPTPRSLAACAALNVVCKHVTSNAIVIGGLTDRAVATFGIGGGQVDRVGACTIAVRKAGAKARGAIGVSDGFFPFDDGPRQLIEAGVTTIVQPGGSKRDADTIALCNEHGVTCLMTGIRHFKH